MLSNIPILLLLIIVGCFLLIKGADFLVDNSTLLAKCYNVPMLVIGMTIVAFGTSMPEMIVNIISSIEGNTIIALTNIYGSNFINILIILGLSALIFPITSKQESLKIDIPFMIVTSSIMLLFNITEGTIQRFEGFFLLIIFSFFLFTQYMNTKNIVEETYENVDKNKLWKYILLIITGLVFLIVGGKMVVYGAENLAQRLGVPDSIIGLTIVALGTSLPELVTSCVAAYKKNVDIALGNIVGSNIFNILCIIGISSLISPLPMYNGVIFDGFVMIMSSILLLICLKSNKNRELKRWHGILFLGLYLFYLIYKIMIL